MAPWEALSSAGAGYVDCRKFPLAETGSLRSFSMESKLHLLESFTAHGPDGARYKVCAYERLVRDETQFTDGRQAWESTGTAEYRLADGPAVEQVRDGLWRVRATGLELRR
jgi:hypothetical protein